MKLTTILDSRAIALPEFQRGYAGTAARSVVSWTPSMRISSATRPCLRLSSSSVMVPDPLRVEGSSSTRGLPMSSRWVTLGHAKRVEIRS